MTAEITVDVDIFDSPFRPQYESLKQQVYYSDYPMEFEVEVQRRKSHSTVVNGTKVTTDKIRVAVKRNDSIDYSDSAYEYIATNLQEGDYIRIRGHLDTAYAWPVIIIERKHANILWHEHE